MCSSIRLCTLWRLIILTLRQKDTDVKLTVLARSSMFYKFQVSRHSKFSRESRKGRTTVRDCTRQLVLAWLLFCYCTVVSCETSSQKKNLKKALISLREREREKDRERVAFRHPGCQRGK